MKYIKKFEVTVFSDDVDYPQVWKKDLLGPFNLRLLNNNDIKLDSYVKVIVERLVLCGEHLKNKIYQVKGIDIDENIYTLGNPRNEIFAYRKEIIPVTEEEYNLYLISNDINKYNL